MSSTGHVSRRRVIVSPSDDPLKHPASPRQRDNSDQPLRSVWARQVGHGRTRDRPALVEMVDVNSRRRWVAAAARRRSVYRQWGVNLEFR
jgi:hypothetical protein